MSGQEGFILVPREPTEAMWSAGAEKIWDFSPDYAPTTDAGATVDRSAEYIANETFKAMLSAAPASPQPQGVGTHKCFECGEELVTLCLACNPLAQAAHPQPSGDGLSDDDIRKMYQILCRDDRYAMLNREQIAIALARAVEARVRSQPVQQGGGDFSISAEEKHKTIAAICEEVEHCTLPAGAIMTNKQVRHFRMYEAARQAFTAATFLQPPHPPTPTDEWRRALERIAAIKVSRNIPAEYIVDIAIRALSPTKPDAPPHTKEGE